VTTLVVPAARIGDLTVGTAKMAAGSTFDVLQSEVANWSAGGVPLTTDSATYDIASAIDVSNTFAHPIFVEVTRSGFVEFQVEPADALVTGGAVAVKPWVFIQNITDSVSVSSMEDWAPSIIRQEFNGSYFFRTQSVPVSFAYKVPIPAGKTYRFTPRVTRQNFGITQSAAHTLTLKAQAFILSLTVLKK
jgi:hypothetical protein